ncbi:hypothetical protein, partial [Clostridioides difficile]|uniref:hypothetical protein n=1 Tax=Clostridioides difficile TaxID=1496 RepID=UPI001A9A6884
MDNFANEKSNSTIKAMTAEIIEGTPTIIKRYPDLPRGVSESYRDTLTWLCSSVIMASARQRTTEDMQKRN